jgi:hypothetical protein
MPTQNTSNNGEPSVYSQYSTSWVIDVKGWLCSCLQIPIHPLHYICKYYSRSEVLFCTTLECSGAEPWHPYLSPWAMTDTNGDRVRYNYAENTTWRSSRGPTIVSCPASRSLRHGLLFLVTRRTTTRR